jgi:hypothetical protein
MLRNKFGVWALAMGAAVSWSMTAQADTITVLDNYTIERSVERERDEEPQTISLKDCEENADVVFSLTVTQESGTRPMVVWVGPESCLDLETRTELCHPAYAQEVGANNPTVTIPSALIVSEDESCETEASSTTSVSATLTFAFEGDNGQPDPDGSDTLVIRYDVRPPEPPNFTSLGQGDGQLSAVWDPLEGEDVQGYKFYCQSSVTTQAEVDGGGLDERGAGGQGGADAGGCATSMIPGERPPEDAFFCGEQAGKTAGRGTVEGLTNDQVYTVGVLARDLVGNEGVLSNLLCQYPKEVTDFYEAYTQAGGTGGGGFCSLGHRSGASPWSALVLVGLALRWARRRRQRP